MLKQAAKMQRQLDALQSELEKHEIEVTSGGGAVAVRINAKGAFLALRLDPDFLKEDAGLVADTVLEAVRDAAAKAKAHDEAETQRITSAFQMPGMM